MVDPEDVHREMDPLSLRAEKFSAHLDKTIHNDCITARIAANNRLAGQICNGNIGIRASFFSHPPATVILERCNDCLFPYVVNCALFIRVINSK